MGSRLHGIIAKEFLQLWRDRLALTLMLFVPVAMLFIFGWAINTDVKHVPTAVFEQSGGGGGRAPPGVPGAAPRAADRSLQLLAQTTEGVVLKKDEPPLDFRVRAWYNPDLVSAIFIVPGLIGALLMQTTVSVMAIAIVRERERGTLEALVVSPIRRWELLLGKIIP